MNNIFEAVVFQACGHKAHTRSVNRGVDNLHILVLGDNLWRQRKCLNAFKIRFVNIVADNGDSVVALAPFHLIDRSDFLHFIYNIGVVRCDNLRSIVPINLVAVVLFGVVRSGYNHAALAAQIADCEREFGCRTQRIKQIDFDSVCHEDSSGSLAEGAAVVAAVVSQRHLYLFASKLLEQIVAKALCGHPHGVDIHSVGASAHNSAQAACAEFQIAVERLNEFILIVFHHIFHLLLCLFVD